MLSINKKGFYQLVTYSVLVIIILAAIGFMYFTNTKLLELKFDKSSDNLKKTEFRDIRDRMYYCYGTVIDQQKLITDLSCLGLVNDQAISVNKYGYGDCKPGYIKELNNRGYGNVEIFEISVFDAKQGIACPAKLTIYEKGFIVPLILNVTFDPKVGLQGSIFTVNIDFYHSKYPSYITIKVYDDNNNEVYTQDSGALGQGVNNVVVQIDSTGFAPGHYTLSTTATNDFEYYDSIDTAGHFSVIAADNKPIINNAEVSPKKGSIHDSFWFTFNISDYFDLQDVNVILTDNLQFTDTISIKQIKKHTDSNLVTHYTYSGTWKPTNMPSGNTTLDISVIATNVMSGRTEQRNFDQIVVYKADEFAVLIVALEGKLSQRYGSGLATLEQSIVGLEQAITRDGLPAKFLYLDGIETSDLIGIKVNNVHDWQEVNGVLESLIIAKKIEYVLIIGGPHSFPAGQLPSVRETDDLYGDIDKDDIMDIPIGRIGDPAQADLGFMTNTLQNLATYHDEGGLDLSTYAANVMTGRMGTGICSSEQIFGAACATCKATYFNCGLSEANNKGLFMLFMHGTEFSPQEFGCDNTECICTSGITPASTANLELRKSVWMIMPCYGGYITNKDTVSVSHLLTFFDKGGAIYFGSTDLNYGYLQVQACSQTIGGDERIGALYTLIAKRFSPGVRIGDAYVMGKRDYNTQIQHSANHDYQLHVNHLYGDPTLIISNMW